MEYSDLALRNAGYISKELQKKIQNTKLLIAGCGIGSTIAEALLRIGFVNQLLVDADKVSVHNLNRQNYIATDIGRPKAEALAERLKSIYPSANIEVDSDYLSEKNVKYLVAKSDLIIDSIDFLSLSAIVSLHDECCVQTKPIVSTVSAGWGAVGIYFPSENRESSLFRELFDLPTRGNIENISYVEKFAKFMDRMSDAFSPEIIKVMASALTIMEDGTPCPAPQLSVGSWCVAALATTMVTRIINQEFVTTAPSMIAINLFDVVQDKGINLR